MAAAVFAAPSTFNAQSAHRANREVPEMAKLALMEPLMQRRPRLATYLRVLLPATLLGYEPMILLDVSWHSKTNSIQKQTEQKGLREYPDLSIQVQTKQFRSKREN